MIVTILVLECANMLRAPQNAPNIATALHQASSQFIASGILGAIKELFSASPEDYTNDQYINFILEKRLSVS